MIEEYNNNDDTKTEVKKPPLIQLQNKKNQRKKTNYNIVISDRENINSITNSDQDNNSNPYTLGDIKMTKLNKNKKKLNLVPKHKT